MNASTTCSIDVHQTLHGYSDGHRLLASSLLLAPDVERVLLVLSDMSGPTMQQGFETYLSGYPVSGTGLYAVSRTWYAPEMERPGCVWTHTLLVKGEELASLPSVTILTSLFSRPRVGEPQSSYRSPISLEVPLLRHAGSHRSLNGDSDLTARIVAALYSLPIQQVFVAAEHVGQCEGAILAIWNSQWPGLRQRFAFCTGSLSNRKTTGKLLDIQVIPRSIDRAVRRSAPSARFVVAGEESESVPDWALRLSEALFSSSPNMIAEFIAAFAEDFPPERSAVVRLLRTLSLVEGTRTGRSTVSDLTLAVASLFPSANAGSTLKRAVFSGRSDSRWAIPESSEAEVLKELVTGEHASAFEPEDLGIRARAGALWRQDPPFAMSVAVSPVLGSGDRAWEQFLQGVADAVSGEDIAQIAAQTPDLAFRILAMNPHLAADPSLWAVSTSSQRAIFRALADTGHGEGFPWREVVFAMLSSGSDALASEVASVRGERLVGDIIDWFDSSDMPSIESLPYGWRKILEAQPFQSLSWLAVRESPRDASAALVAGLLDPYSAHVQQVGTDVWERLVARTDLSEVERGASTRAMVFLLSLGLENCGAHPYQLVATSFQPVHDAIARNEVGFRALVAFKSRLPELPWWSDWDTCERLRRGLVHAFRAHRWPLEYLLKSARDEYAFGSIVDYCCHQGWGAAFLRRLAGSAREGWATSFQQSRLLRYK